MQQLGHQSSQRSCYNAAQRPGRFVRLAQRRAVRVLAAITSDASARVHGNCRAVFHYTADLMNLPQWYPGVSEVTTTRGAGKPLNIRHQYEAQQTIAGFKLPVLYEVVDMQQDRKIVFSVGSDLHHATEQLVFMPDPNNPAFTIVRHMSHVELTEWRKALQPFAAGIFKKLPEQGMSRLVNLLNSSNSPLRSAKYAESERAGRRGSQHSGGWNFNNMFSSLRSEMGSDGGSPAASRAAKAAAEVDALGYYAALGLDGKRSRNVSAEDIKSAFRRAAITMHPDKFSQAAQDEQKLAEEAFRKVQQAYEVLRDPDQRRAYDEGRLPSPQHMEESMA